jgi:16S rRNA (guanine527-N7)-methyltransferase
MDLILKYFRDLNKDKLEKLKALLPLYLDWNEKINLISRKDMDSFYEHHVLHSLCIAKFVNFKNGTTIMDVGTGGGFPGIPLAIMFPDVKFYLVDSIGKKIKVVNAVTEELGLKNVRNSQVRAEEVKEKFDFIVSRAVTDLEEFYKWVRNKISKDNFNHIHNGIIYLKGGDISSETKGIKAKIKVKPISDYFEEEYFVGKKIVYIA